MARIELKCPPLGVSVFTGTLAEWFVKPGDSVKKDQAIWSVETDKVTQDVLASHDGVVAELLVEVGEVVEPEMVVGYIETDASAAAAASTPAKKEVPAAANGQTAPPKAAAPAVTTVATPAPPPASNGTAQGTLTGRPNRFSPSVRRLMREHRLTEQEMLTISGSGRNGRIKASDVERYLASGRSAEVSAPAALPTQATSPAAPAPGAAPQLPVPQIGSATESWEATPLTTIRKTIATYLRQSVDQAVHTVSIDECDVTRLLEIRKGLNAVTVPKYGVKLTVTTFIAKAIATALTEFPMLNSQIDLEKGEVRTARHIHLGIAVDAPQGLTVPVVRFADQMSLVQLQVAINEIAAKVRAGKAQLADLQGSTYTITNAGAEGSIASTPIINYPNVGITGVHKIRRMPVVRDDQVVIRDMVNLSAAFDHRLVDGVYNVRFMNRVIQLLEAPERMLI